MILGIIVMAVMKCRDEMEGRYDWAILNEARLIEEWNLAEQEKSLKKNAPLG